MKESFTFQHDNDQKAQIQVHEETAYAVVTAPSCIYTPIHTKFHNVMWVLAYTTTRSKNTLTVRNSGTIMLL